MIQAAFERLFFERIKRLLRGQEVSDAGEGSDLGTHP
jgi:hypothetical protein